MRSKIILIYEEDQPKLNRYLNEQSEQGWHAVSINMFRIKFDFDKDKRYYYNVVLKGSMVDLTSTPEVFDKHSDLMASFDFDQISKHPHFLIYRSNIESTLYTDDYIDSKPSKKAANKMFFSSFSVILIALLNFYTISLNGIYGILISNMTQLALILTFILLIHGFIRLRNTILLRKGKLSNTLNYRWNAKYIDPLTLIYFAFLISLLPIVLPGILIPFVAPIIIMAIMITFVSKLKLKLITRYVLYALLALITTIITINIMFNYTWSQLPSEGYGNESWIAKHHTTQDLTWIYVKRGGVNDFMINGFLDNQWVFDEIPKNKVIEMDFFGTTRYVFRSDNYALISDTSVPDEFFEDFLRIQNLE